ncbi:MAG TPA: PmoA family protein [Puia sp.]|nr:PmoA family protein [Puia sp.]
MINYTLRKRLRKLRILYCAGLGLLLPALLHAQPLPIKVENNPAARTITITAGGKPFTTFIYPDSLAKPVLYPIYAADGQLITRGFPLATRAGEPVDHPHHLGLWFNYENVNGFDFWNNSYAIPAAKKAQYGWIRTDSILEAGNAGPKSGDQHYPNTNTTDPASTGRAMPGHAAGMNVANGLGIIRYAARWTNQQNETLLTERTTYIFSAGKDERIITRLTTLTAVADGGVSFPDAKDGMLGLRVTKELQIPSNTPGEFVDDKGNITKVAAGNTPDINGNYLTSEGKAGDSAWGTRGNWCLLYGKKQQDTLSIAIIDHPANPGYPTYWHARGYGLFAANPLGEKIFSNGRQTMNFRLEKGQSVTFRYRIVITAGNNRLSTGRIRQLADDFARVK